MIYKNDISRISFGCMRLPRDAEKSEKYIMHALDLGINYFDTAYIYPGNEEMLGKIISKNGCRGRMKIATKLPHYMVKNAGDFEKYFSTQLKRLGTDHVDHYLMHMLPDVKTWERLKELGVLEWLESKRKAARSWKLDFPITAAAGISSNWSMPLTGISLRSSITIWMNILRPAVPE